MGYESSKGLPKALNLLVHVKYIEIKIRHQAGINTFIERCEPAPGDIPEYNRNLCPLR